MARKSDQIASLFASVGFIVDKQSITALENSLKRVEGRLASISKGFGKLKGSNSVTTGLRNTSRDAGKATTAIEGLTNAFRSGIPAMSQYAIQLNAAASAMRALAGAAPRRLPSVPGSNGQGGTGGRGGRRNGGLFGDFGDSLFGGGVAGFARGVMPGLGAGWAAVNVVRQGREMAAAENAFSALSGSQAGGKAEMKYLENFSNQYGLDIRGGAEGYKRILASSVGTELQGKGAKDIFEGTSLFGATLGLSSENMSRATTAISQMISKGKVSSEELKGQLAEALPGAVQIFADAMNVPVDQMFKMMEDGKVLAKDVLPEVSRILKERANAGGALDKYLESSLAKQYLLTNAWRKFVKTVFESGLDKALATFFSGLTGILNVLNDIAPVAIQLGVAWAAWRIAMLALPFAQMALAMTAFNIAMLGGFGPAAIAMITRFGAAMMTVASRILTVFLPILMIVDTIYSMFSSDVGILEEAMIRSGAVEGFGKFTQGIEKTFGINQYDPNAEQKKKDFETGRAALYREEGYKPTGGGIPLLDRPQSSINEIRQGDVAIHINGGDLAEVERVVRQVIVGEYNGTAVTAQEWYS